MLLTRSVHVQAMQAAQAALGIIPVIRPGYTPKQSLYELRSTAQSAWSEDWYKETFFTDAGKIDIAQMNLAVKGIGGKGDPKPSVVCSPTRQWFAHLRKCAELQQSHCRTRDRAASPCSVYTHFLSSSTALCNDAATARSTCNAQRACMQRTKLTGVTHGRFPYLQFYCALHMTFGAKAWLVHTGSGGGKKSLDVWEGTIFWTMELEEWERQGIIDMKYFNRTEAIVAVEAKNPRFFEGPFDPKKFLVRNSSALSSGL